MASGDGLHAKSGDDEICTSSAMPEISDVVGSHVKAVAPNVDSLPCTSLSNSPSKSAVMYTGYMYYGCRSCKVSQSIFTF